MAKVAFTYNGKTHTREVSEDFFDLPVEKQNALNTGWIHAQEATGQLGSATDFMSDAWDKGVTGPLARVKQIYGQQVDEGFSTIGKAFDEGSPRNPILPSLQLIGGAIQSTFALPTAIAQTYLGEPVEKITQSGLDTVTRARGGDPELTRDGYGPAQFLGDAAAFAGEVFSPVQLIRSTVSQIPKVAHESLHPIWKLFAGVDRPLTSTAPIARVGDDTDMPSVPGAVDEIPSTADDIPTGTGSSEELGLRGFINRMTDQTQADVIVNVDRAALEEAGDSERLFKRVSRLLIGAIEDGSLATDDLSKVMDEYNLDPVQFAKEYEETISFSGRSLARLSALARSMARNAPELDDAARLELEQIADAQLRKAEEQGGKIYEAFRSIENARRGLLVTQFVTAIRNYISQGGRFTIGAVDDIFAGAIRGGGGRESLDNIWNTLTSNFHALKNARLKDKNRTLINHILEGKPLTKAMLLNKSVHEVEAVGKIIHALNGMNRWQEKFYRKLAFEARLRQNVKRLKLGELEEIDPKKIPAEALQDAVNYALEVSFAADPKSKAIRGFLQGWNKSFGTLINPFPRFHFANAIPFLAQHSPLGYAKALSPSTLKKLAQGNPEEFSRAASRATLGTVFMGVANEIRKEQREKGAKWYEYVVSEDPLSGEQIVIDLRGYAPFSTYLLISDLMHDPGGLKAADWATALVSINRIAGTGLMMVDALRAKDADTMLGTLAKFGGIYTSGFTTPIRQVSDVYSAFDKEGAKYRDTRGDTVAENLLLPMLANIPVLNQRLPVGKSAIHPGELKPMDFKVFGMNIPGSLARQISGITARRKNFIEQEVDKLDIPYSKLQPTPTGSKKIDRYLKGIMGVNALWIYGAVMKNPKWKQMDDFQKRELFELAVPKLRQIAVAHLLQNAPDDIKNEFKALRMSASDKRKFEEATGVDIRDAKQRVDYFRSAPVRVTGYN